MLKPLKHWIGLALSSCFLVVACSFNTTSSSTQPLKLGIGLWPGYAGGYVAFAQNLFEEEEIEVEEVAFQNLGSGITTFLAGQTDVLWATSADAVQLHSEDPSIKVIYLTDYSNGGDGVVGRNINQPEDLEGKTIAREDLLFTNVLLQAYLDQANLTFQDVVLQDMAAPDAAAAFAARKVDAVVSYEPWMTKAAQEGEGEILFTSRDTNLLADVMLARDSIIESRKSDLQALIRAIDRGTEMVNSNDEAALNIVAERLGVNQDEAKQQLASVKFFDIEGNQTVGFDPEDQNSLIRNLEFTAKVAYELNVIPEPLETRALYDDSVVKSL